MSAQRLSDKSRRRIERITGLGVVRAWAHGGYDIDFVIIDDNPVGHLHGTFDKKTNQWWIHDVGERGHYNTCREMFPMKEDG